MTHHTRGDSQGQRPTDAPEAADRLTRLTHDLSSLLDGSLRWMSLVERGWSDKAVMDETELSETRRQLASVRSALERMSELVAAAAGRDPDGRGSPSLAEAMDHAVDVLRPLASTAGATLTIEVTPEAGPISAGPLYSVLLNATQNALDAGATSVTLRAFVESEGQTRTLAIEVIDDGAGSPPAAASGAVFAPGFTTRGSGRGHGLAIAADIVRSLDGELGLEPRENAAGARFWARLPVEDAS